MFAQIGFWRHMALLHIIVINNLIDLNELIELLLWKFKAPLNKF